MNSVRFGRTIRALRMRRGWRQQDLGDAAGTSQGLVSLVERGFLDGVTLRRLQRIAEALGAELTLLVRWRGGEIDRLLDEGHASLVGRAAALLEGLGWAVAVEVTFAVFRDRGSIDLLAWHAATSTLLVIEVKTELTSIEETLRAHDTKVRLAAHIAAERFDWHARVVARLLVLPDTSTARRRVEGHRAVLRRTYAIVGHEARAWLRVPTGTAGLLVHLSPTIGGRGRCGPLSRKRVTRAGGARPRA